MGKGGMSCALRMEKGKIRAETECKQLTFVEAVVYLGHGALDFI